MSYSQFQDSYQRAADAELDLLSRQSTEDLMTRIESKKFGLYNQVFAALARKGEPRTVAPFLANQLKATLTLRQRSSCASALLSVLPYAGIPVHALANPSHPGHSLYLADIENLLRKQGSSE